MSIAGLYLLATTKSKIPHSDKHVILPTLVTQPTRSIETLSMTNSGATGNLIDQAFSNKIMVSITQKSQPQGVQLVDRTGISAGLISPPTTVQLNIKNQQETIKLKVTNQLMQLPNDARNCLATGPCPPHPLETKLSQLLVRQVPSPLRNYPWKCLSPT